MVVDSGYMCEKCKKIYHKSQSNLPKYCKKCGEDLVKERYLYNLMKYHGEVVETKDTNMFGGYDYVKTILTDSVKKVKLRRKFLFSWELFSR